MRLPLKAWPASCPATSGASTAASSSIWSGSSPCAAVPPGATRSSPAPARCCPSAAHTSPTPAAASPERRLQADRLVEYDLRVGPERLDEGPVGGVRRHRGDRRRIDMQAQEFAVRDGPVLGLLV